ENGNVTVWSMAFEHGRSNGDGGAIHNSGQLYLHYTTFEDNLAQRGGAIYSIKKLVIDTSTLKNNTAMQGGGAVQTRLKARFAAIPETYIMNSTFSNNRAKIDGGAVRNAGHLTVTASTFSHNLTATGLTETTTSTQNRGSAIWTFTTTEYTTKIYDSTFVGNNSHPMTTPNQAGETASERMDRHQNHGATIYNHTVSSSASLILTRTVIAKSQGRNCGGSGHFITDHSWSDDTTCARRDEIGTNSGNPKLYPLADHGGYTLTHFPKQESGLVNAAGNDCAEYDQRGARRYYSKPCDIGSVERAPAAPIRPVPIQIDKTIPNAYVDTHITRGELEKLIGKKEAQIAEKQEGIEEKETLIAEKQAEIEAKATMIAEKQAEIEAKATMIAERQAEIEAKSATIAEKMAQIAELEAPDDLEVAMGGAGKIDGLRLNGNNVLHDSETRVKAGSETFNFADTLTSYPHDRADGSTVSVGRFQGENGTIYWTITSTVVPRTNFHVSRWEFSSPQAFGDVVIGIYADLDIGQYTGHNGLIVGGTGHPNRLLITDRSSPAEGVALGLRALKNASRMGWVGSPDIYHGRNGEVLDASILTGAYSGWGKFTPDQSVYPGAHGYGPADIAVAMGVMLKSSAKLASFETTIVGAPNGRIE
uniref:choice-of-anchor Q domain-containing protein n=1 Tax=Thiolapillus sp. TaxID=2017437 RepID=UPI003AF5F8CB